MGSADPYFPIADAIIVAAFGDTVMYSRPIGPRLDAVAPFALSMIAETGGEYSDPRGPIYADLKVNLSDIPMGPQKGDQLVYSGTKIKAGTYIVQSIYTDPEFNTGHLKIRWKST